jgi:c-di-GMP-binding flagellar brake protein YcgR
MSKKKPYVKPTVKTRPLHPADLQAGGRFAERRAHPRYVLIAPTDILEPIANIRLSGRTAEISLGGCYVDLANPLPKGAVIELAIQRDLSVLKTWGRVAYAHEQVGMGVQFLDTAPDQRAVLQQWIHELSSSEWTTL